MKIYNTNEDIRKKLYTLPDIQLPAGLRHNIYDKEEYSAEAINAETATITEATTLNS